MNLYRKGRKSRAVDVSSEDRSIKIVLRKIKPIFWNHVESSGRSHTYDFNFRRIWKIATTLTTLVALIPLAVMTVVDYKVSKDAMESEALFRTSRLVSNTRRSVTYFLEERISALNYVKRGGTYETLQNPDRLESDLMNMQESFGGFVDLGVIDDQGSQVTYVGPYALEGKNYYDSEWFKAVSAGGIYVSDVFKGFRNIPHMVIAVKQNKPDGGFYILRATLDLSRLNNLLSQLEIAGGGDAFLINHAGILQTPSRHYGKVLDKINVPFPEYSPEVQFEQLHVSESDSLLLVSAFITPETPFILMVVKPKRDLLTTLTHNKKQLIGFLLVSAMVIVIVILYGTTYLVNQIYRADQRRLSVMHQVEYAHKMASLGRLSAGVAHEINNPLAVISEKAGLARDLYAAKDEADRDPKILELIESISFSVVRCSKITHRLLSFARRSDIRAESVSMEEVVQEVLGFIGKEAEYRSIKIVIETDENTPPVVSDRGRLQEIFLNLFTNAFTAMEDGGTLSIHISHLPPSKVVVSCHDTGHGIPKSDLERIFEPFFSTKTGSGGTGLGLSITYRLLWEIGGKIEVESEVGNGTTFTVTLPLTFTEASGNKSTNSIL
jgi:two-component system, NtrC family, sensor kinase